LCLGGTRNTARPDFLRLGNRYAEFCGWLNQDQGRYPEAEAWTRKAIDFAQALDDPHLVSYTLMRRSNIASDAGHAHEALTLAEAAIRQRPSHPGSAPLRSARRLRPMPSSVTSRPTARRTTTAYRAHSRTTLFR
jgi:tetratricopeptide (TPR) repeat protein